MTNEKQAQYQRAEELLFRANEILAEVGRGLDRLSEEWNIDTHSPKAEPASLFGVMRR